MEGGNPKAADEVSNGGPQEGGCVGRLELWQNEGLELPLEADVEYGAAAMQALWMIDGALETIDAARRIIEGVPTWVTVEN